MFMAYLRDEKRRWGGYGQKALAKRYLNYKYWNLVDNAQQSMVSDEAISIYNAEDVFVLRRLYEVLWEKLQLNQRI